MASLTLRLAISSTLLFYQQPNNQSLECDRSDTKKTSPVTSDSFPEVRAQYPGGLRAWNNFLKENAQFSKFKRDTALPIFLAFSVDKNGGIENIKIIGGNNPIDNKEAIRLLRLSSPWLPATRNNKPETCSMSIRITPRNY